MTDVSRRVREVLAATLRTELTAIGPDAAFGVTPEWDSLSHVALMTALEHEFGLQIGDDEIVDLIDVEAIEAAVRRVSGDRTEK
jgi:acyl carrier protein